MTTTATAHNFEADLRRMNPVAAPPEQHDAVAAILRLLGSTPHTPSPQCQLVGPRGESIRVPESVFYVLERVVEVLARGDSVTVVPVGQELTTQQAAELLNVSRQYLVRLLDDGHIRHTKTGKHRRVRIEDILSFKDKRDSDRQAKLRKLTEMTEDFGGYDAEVK